MPTAHPPVARTPLHFWHAAHGARFIDRDGWQAVAGYTSLEREVEAARNGLAVADISAFSTADLWEGQLLEEKNALRAQAGFWIVGPRWEEFLRRLTHLDVHPRSFPVNTSIETAVAGVEAMLVRSEVLSVPAVRVHVGWDIAEYVWERMLEAGHELGITPVGKEALSRLLSGN